ncbi:Mitotic spindle assembly checkpoint protein MAD2A [Labeo rohita]|uniref:Mitotic spindle assembly checkpoint protein MAD2A n=1 Tax=Labeo rohita TaxID=84645 RepID=A0ABQ8MHD0_LABRO|nr:Mitotic spindle assembly checkpoint protein MAD2A [Labeo rohita]
MRQRQTQCVDSNSSAVKKKQEEARKVKTHRNERKLNYIQNVQDIEGNYTEGECGAPFGINSILYQRGIYPAETFTRVTQYDMSLHLTTDAKLKNYLTNVISQLKEWLFDCTVQKLVVVITCLETNEVLERWQFDIQCDKTAKESSAPREKSLKAIQEEIRSVIRQITATVTFLPLLETACAFDLLIYTDKDLEVPEQWEESGPQLIDQSEEVRLRSFTTSIHKGGTFCFEPVILWTSKSSIADGLVEDASEKYLLGSLA